MNNSKRIAQGGLLLALFSLLLIITVQIPFLGMISFYFLPVPFILVMMKEQISWTFGFLVMASLLTLLFGGLASVPLTVFIGVVGMLIGYHLKYNKSSIQLIISSVLTIIAGLLILYEVTIVVVDVNIMKEFQMMYEQSIDTSIDMMKSLNQPIPENFEETMQNAFVQMFKLIPTILVIFSIILSYLFTFAAQPFVKRFTNKSVNWPHFRDLRLPKSLLWYYIIVLLASHFVTMDENSFMYTAFLNLVYILQFFITLQGISFLFFISNEKGWVKAVPIVLVVISLVSPILLTIERILGIIDLSFPLRETVTKQK